jgi:hypothetical protein
VDINAAVSAIEEFLRGYKGVADTQVRPSGDDLDVIKIWVDLAMDPSEATISRSRGIDAITWTTECEAAIRVAVPGASAFRLKFQTEP